MIRYEMVSSLLDKHQISILRLFHSPHIPISSCRRVVSEMELLRRINLETNSSSYIPLIHTLLIIITPFNMSPVLSAFPLTSFSTRHNTDDALLLLPGKLLETHVNMVSKDKTEKKNIKS